MNQIVQPKFIDRITDSTYFLKVFSAFLCINTILTLHTGTGIAQTLPEKIPQNITSYLTVGICSFLLLMSLVLKACHIISMPLSTLIIDTVLDKFNLNQDKLDRRYNNGYGSRAYSHDRLEKIAISTKNSVLMKKVETLKAGRDNFEINSYLCFSVLVFLSIDTISSILISAESYKNSLAYLIITLHESISLEGELFTLILIISALSIISAIFMALYRDIEIGYERLDDDFYNDLLDSKTKID